MSELSKNVIEKIRGKHIKPLPKWMFIAGHIVVWGLFILSIVIGSAAVSLGLYKIFVINDWELVGRLPGGGVGGFLLILPYMWILIMGLMIFVAFKLFEKTEKGYKLNPWIVIALSLVISFILGSILFASRTAEGMENFMRQNIKPYKTFVEIREEVWHAPETGILPGRIVAVEGDVMIMMDDFNGKTWKVDITDAKLPPMMIFKVGDLIIAVGEVTGIDEFEAEGIRPAKILKNRLMQPLQNGRQKN
jgi:hypothetical protein